MEPTHEATRSSVGWWSSQEVMEMITLKELKPCRHGFHQNVEVLRGRTVKLYQDNQSVCGALRKMSSKCPALMAEIKDLVPWIHENKIRLDVVYIRSETNLVDAPSRQRGLGSSPRNKSSCTWSSRHWARRSLDARSFSKTWGSRCHGGFIQRVTGGDQSRTKPLKAAL